MNNLMDKFSLLQNMSLTDELQPLESQDSVEQAPTELPEDRKQMLIDRIKQYQQLQADNKQRQIDAQNLDTDIQAKEGIINAAKRMNEAISGTKRDLGKIDLGADTLQKEIARQQSERQMLGDTYKAYQDLYPEKKLMSTSQGVFSVDPLDGKADMIIKNIKEDPKLSPEEKQYKLALIDKLKKETELMGQEKSKELTDLDRAKISKTEAETKKILDQIENPDKYKKTDKEKENPAIKKLNEEYAKEYNKFTSNGKNNALNTIKKLKEYAKRLKDESKEISEESGGKYSTMLPDFMRSTEALEYRDQIPLAANKTLKELFGGQLSDAEREAAAREFYNDKMGAGKNAEILEGKIKELEDNLKSQTEKAKYFEKNKTLEGYTPELNQTVNEVERVTKDGRTAIFNADTKQFIRFK